MIVKDDNYKSCFYALFGSKSNHEVPKLRVTYDYGIGSGISFRKFVKSIETSLTNAQLNSDLNFIKITQGYQAPGNPLINFRHNRFRIPSLGIKTHLAVAQSSPLYVEGTPNLLRKIDPGLLTNVTMSLEADTAKWVFIGDSLGTNPVPIYNLQIEV